MILSVVSSFCRVRAGSVSRFLFRLLNRFFRDGEIFSRVLRSIHWSITPIVATFPGWSIFTGDESIRTRPVGHLAQALEQLGAKTHISRPDVDAPPLLVQGPISAGKVITDGRLSQYISGMMMAASRIHGTLEIELTDPKEVPYLDMTKMWLESLGIPVQMSADYKHIVVGGPHSIPALSKDSSHGLRVHRGELKRAVRTRFRSASPSG